MRDVRRLPTSVLILVSLASAQIFLLAGLPLWAGLLPAVAALLWGMYRAGALLWRQFTLLALTYAAALWAVGSARPALAAGFFAATVTIGLFAFSADMALTANRVRQRWMKDISEPISGGVLFMDAAGRVIFANSLGSGLLGVADAIGHEFHELAHGGRLEAPGSCALRSVLSGGQTYTERSDIFLSGPGKVFPVACTASAIIRSGRQIGSMVFFRDTTLEEQAGAFVRHSEQSYHLLFEKNPNPMWIYDAGSLKFLAVNSAAVGQYGYSKEEFLRMKITDIRPESDVPALLASLSRPDPSAERAWRHRTRHGMLIDVQTTATDIVYGERRGRLVMAIDVTDKRLAREAISRLTHYDALTELPNRQQLLEHVDTSIAQADQNGRGVAIMLLDLDRFRDVNDSFGRATGDGLLKVVAGRLLARVRKGDVVAREANDQFFVLLSEVRHLREIPEAAERLLKIFDEPFLVGEREIFAAASLGIAHYPVNARNADELLHNAESALYFAKTDGGGKYAVFEADMQAMTTKRRTMEDALRRGIENHEFILHYQPQIDIQSGKITGMEALVRWNHPTLGLVGPSDFIPLAEDTGLIVPMGEWILRAACEQHRRWYTNGKGLRMGVNLSPRQLLDPELPSTVERILSETGMQARHLELEVTESSFVRNAAAALDTFGQLRAMGASLSIDDFGTGYSSLSYLKRFPFNTLKIDRAFVTGINNDEFDRALVHSITTVAHNRNMLVIAEGVETSEQLETLRDIGCEEVQGFYFSKPLDTTAFSDFVRDWRA